MPAITVTHDAADGAWVPVMGIWRTLRHSKPGPHPLGDTYPRDEMQALSDERGHLCGYVHTPSGMLFTPKGNFSVPRHSRHANKAHNARRKAADAYTASVPANEITNEETP